MILEWLSNDLSLSQYVKKFFDEHNYAQFENCLIRLENLLATSN